MKYIVLVGDGMADRKCAELGDKTPLQYAQTPHMDLLVKNGEIGLVQTVPEGFQPGSDVANLSVMGYDPREFYTGRSPLEAVSMGIELDANDVAFRCNLVTLSGDEPYEKKTMDDYSAGEISTSEARELIAEIDRAIGGEQMRFYGGISYRHLLVWKNGQTNVELTPPHDISGRCIGDYLPKGSSSDILLKLMNDSSRILSRHQVNEHRVDKGLKPANSIWFWGEGKRPSILRFKDKYGLSGSVISAVDLIKGIGICAGLDVVDVPGATGNIHTNFRGKALAALEELKKGKEFVFIHVEAPDEAGHQGELDTKIRAIEEIDRNVLGLLLEGLEEIGDYKIMLLPDHPTPLCIKTHSTEPVPFVIMSKNGGRRNNFTSYDEKTAELSGLKIDSGYKLMDYFLR